MDQAQARDFSVSLSNQISNSYPQGTRQHVNISQSQDNIFNLSHSHSRPQSRQQQEVSRESNRLDLTSNISHNILHKNVSSSFSTYLPESFSHLHSTQHDHSHGMSKQANITVQTSQRQLEYSHQNSPIDSLRQSADYSPSHMTHRKQHFTSAQNQQQHKILQSEDERQTDRQEFAKRNFGEESHKPAELFYEHEIKKDSEIKLTNSDIQYLANTENQSSVHSGESNKQSHTTNTSSPSETEVTQSMELKAKSQILQLQSDRAHVCLTCYKTFKNKPQLTQHELVHNGVRKHVCMYCDKAFKQICHLNQHTRVHTGERPYKCTIEGCGRAFAQLSNLNHHMKNHEEHVRRDISKQYRCDVCDRSYANQNSLHTHIQKLHMNLKAAEGSTSNPITLGSPSKKRKKKNKQQASAMPDPATLAAQEAAQQYMLHFSDSDDDGLPTQVRSKSESELKANTINKMATPQVVDKNHTGQKLSLPASLGQAHGLPFSEKLPNLQQFTQIKSEHGQARTLDQTGLSKDNGEMQLSQTYSPGHTPPTTTKADNLHRDIQQPTHRDVTRALNDTAITANGSPASNIPLPFLIHSNPNISSAPISSTLFSQLPPISLSQSVADSLPSHIRHHFPDVLTASHLERDSRSAMAQNFFHPAFSDQSSKTEQNRFR